MNPQEYTPISRSGQLMRDILILENSLYKDSLLAVPEVIYLVTDEEASRMPIKEPEVEADVADRQDVINQTRLKLLQCLMQELPLTVTSVKKEKK